MAMNVKPIPMLDDRINDIRLRTAAILNEWILPNETRIWNFRRGDLRSDEDREQARKEATELRTEIKQQVKKAGLWAAVRWPDSSSRPRSR